MSIVRGNLSFSLALRYLNPLRTYFSIISLICLLGVSFGVMVLIVVLSVMNGLQKEMQGRLLAFAPHIEVSQEFDSTRYPLGDWRELSESLKKAPGVKSAYAIIEDYALVDAEGSQRPCYFRAIDTEDQVQMNELKTLVRDGSFEMDMGEQVVLSTTVADSLKMRVGDKLKVYTTRNFDQVSHAYALLDKPLLNTSHTAQIEALEKLLASGTATAAGDTWKWADMSPILQGIRELFSRAERESEADLLESIAEAVHIENWRSLESDTPPADDSIVTYPAGTQKAWVQAVSTLKGMDKDKEDLLVLKTIKSLVLPKDLEVVGIYQASQHVQGPDMFIPIGIGQELLGYEDDLVRAIALRVENPFEVEAEIARIKAGLPQLRDGAMQWRMDTWKDRFAQWFSLINKERMMMSFVLSFISLISAFCIMAVMFTVAIQRKKEIAVMKALGATPWQVVCVFLWQGVIIGAIGAVLGVGLAALVVENRDVIYSFMASKGFDFFPMDYHGMDLPAEMSARDVTIEAIKAFLMVVLASVVPALVSARQDPAKSLRSL